MTSEPPLVRVRGPYATALSKLLHDAGLEITQPSRVMQERMGLDDTNEPAKVTVKQADTPGIDLLIVGLPQAHDRVLRVLRDNLSLSSYATSPLQLYSTIVVEVKGEEGGKCIAEHGGISLFLETRSCIPGKITTAYVRRAPPNPEEPPLAREGFSILMDTLILFNTGPVTFSKHIYDLERTAFLESISLKAKQKGYGVRWRSNAAKAPRELIERELEQALVKAEEFSSPLAAASLSPGEVLMEGNLITLCSLSLPDKRKLDDMRRSVTPTIDYHHSLKTGGPRLDLVVEYSEHLLEKNISTPQELGEVGWDYAWHRLSETPRVTLTHSTPEARVLRIGPAKPVGKTSRGRGILLERVVKQDGVYDALGVEKQRGDVITTVVMENAWALAHAYWSSQGELKGIYVNVNTPPEPGEGHVRYLDLHIDVVQVPGGSPRVVDRDKLETALSAGRIGEDLYKRALETAQSLERWMGEERDLLKDGSRENVLSYIEDLVSRTGPA